MGKKKLGKRERAKLAAAAAAGGADTTATPVPMVVEEAEPVAPEPVAVPVVDEVKKPKRVKTAVKAESERAPPAKAAATSAPKPAPKPAAKPAAKPAPALAPTPKPAAKPTPAAVKRPAMEGAGGESKKPRKRAKKGGKRVTRLDGEAAFPLPLHHSKEMETFFCFRCDIDKVGAACEEERSPMHVALSCLPRHATPRTAPPTFEDYEDKKRFRLLNHNMSN